MPRTPKNDPANSEPSNSAPSHSAPSNSAPSNSEPSRSEPSAEAPQPTEQIPVGPIPTAPAPTAPEPTAQITADSAPVHARSAASGGETGLGSMAGSASKGSATSKGSRGSATDSSDNLFRRHPWATGITAGIIVVIVVSGLTAWGVGTAVTASLTSSHAQVVPTPTSTTPGEPAAGLGTTAGARVAFRATIQTIDQSSNSSSTWTILTKQGKTVKVAVDSATTFGTKRNPEDASSFAVGDSIVIVATRSGGTITATRVVEASALGAGLGGSTNGSDSGTST